MKKNIVLLFVVLFLPVMLFASSWQKIEKLDEFGDSTGKSEIVLSNQSGTYNSVSGGVKNGKLVWECHTIPNGYSYIILKEQGVDANLSTAKYKSDTFTIKVKCDDDTMKSFSGKIALNGNAYNKILFDSSYSFQSLIASNKNLKIVVSSDNGEGTYSLGKVNSGDFEELVFEKTVYNQANKLIEKQKMEEARTLLIKFKKSNPNGYKYLNCNYLYGKTINGPAGGYIFYDCDADNDSGNADGLISSECGWRYLEAAPKDLDGTFKWGDEGNYGTMTAVGTGKNNTEKIVKNASKSRTNNAAVACADYSVNGYEDWFLPSEGELCLMYLNLKENGFGGFCSEDYWSSSEYYGNPRDAWYLSFGIGYQFSNGRYDSSFVRACRAF